MSSTPDNKPLLFYDGYCNLCNSSVQFVLKHEKNADILFASLQSETGKHLLSEHHLENVDSVVLKTEKGIFVKSDAALETARYLKAPYRWVRVFKIIPVKLRNLIYDFIAGRRYKVFGKTDTCRLPSQEEKDRFIDL